MPPPLPQTKQKSRFSPIIIRLFFLVGAIAIFIFAAMYIETLPEADRTKPWIAFFVSMVVFLMICGADHHYSCPKCKSMWSMVDQPRALSHQNVSVKEDKEYVIHRDRNWRVTGSTEIPVKTQVVKNVYDVTRVCSNCGHSISETETE
jgi:hypothetical protein